jgi:hypothetical protein
MLHKGSSRQTCLLCEFSFFLVEQSPVISACECEPVSLDDRKIKLSAAGDKRSPNLRRRRLRLLSEEPVHGLGSKNGGEKNVISEYQYHK